MIPEHGHAPLIITLQLDDVSTAFFQRRRDEFFPERLNIVPAHLTLFHKLPGHELNAVMKAIADAVPYAPFPLAVSHVLPLGRGVAYALTSPALMALRDQLAARFRPWLTAQDREKFRPHVTVQNKVSPAEARRTRDLLERHFTPFEAGAEGLQIWSYEGGPWASVAAVAFGPGH